MYRALLGAIAGLATALALDAMLLPAPGHINIAPVGLIMVVPVVIGVFVGGVGRGAVSVVAGFLVYDLFFIPPYYTISVGSAQNWVALAVYVVVMIVVAQVVSRLQADRGSRLRRGAGEARPLLEVSALLVTDRSLAALLQSTADTVRDVFGVVGVALLLPEDGHLTMVAAAGGGPPAAPP